MASTTRSDHRRQKVAVEHPNQILTKDPRERPLILYTDGSGIKAKTGAAAVVDLEERNAHSQMRDDRTSTVEAKLEWDTTWSKEKTKRPTRRLIEALTKKTLDYWSGSRKATNSILMQLRTERIGLAAYLSRIKRHETARYGCDLKQSKPWPTPCWSARCTRTSETG
ncbi:hypothetical protein PENANT_c186G02594 [Penicillium antarcticum]|uniref:RNase H type-1 domain-containing protein n=1 Tax=Penicillium antarcticum TaxID=416450 RepID=A0A1V6PB37_9EURO|nr:hypothetical protein PENANT_c186G02594 [Penicillium antarcticum]